MLWVLSALALSHNNPLQVAFEIIQQFHFKGDDTQPIHQKMLAGALRALDPYSCYLPPDQYRAIKQMTKGNLCGIGIELCQQDDKVVVQTVIAGSPADQAGIRPNHFITHIDGKKVEPYTPQDVIMARLSGADKTPVIVGINGQHITIKRQDNLKIPTLLVLTLPNKLYVRICYFADTTADELRKVVAENTHVQQIVLDLRNNPGGSLQAAVETVGIFLDTAPVVHIKSHMTIYNKTHICQGRAVCPHIPIQVVINRNTASSAEIVAAALQDHNRAIITGERSLGKGMIQDFFDLPGYGGVKLTVGSFYSPNGHPIQDHGVMPN